MPRIPHDFTIDRYTRLSDRMTVHVARCIEPGCHRISKEFAERVDAVGAARLHQLNEMVKKAVDG